MTQDEIYEEATRLVDRKISCRYWNGVDPEDVDAIDSQIMTLMDVMNNDTAEDFSYFMEGK